MRTEEAVFAAHPQAAHFRYPYLYGPHQPVPREWLVVRRILDGRDRMIIADDGLTLHHQGYTENAAAALLLAIEHPERSAGTIFNIGDEEVLTVRQMIELCAAALGADLELDLDAVRPCRARPGRCSPSRCRPIACSTSRCCITSSAIAMSCPPARPPGARRVWLAENRPEPGGTEEMVLTDPVRLRRRRRAHRLLAGGPGERQGARVHRRCPATVWPTAGRSGGPVPRRSSWNERRQRTMSGIRVLDLSIALTGPYAAALMADQGADVIKVERPGIGDIARWVGVAVNGMSSLYLVCNRGKRSIVADLGKPGGRRGRAPARRRVRRVPAELPARRDGQARASATTTCRPINPDVVYASLSGFGSSGPYRDRSAYDTVIQAYGGLAMNQADPVRRGAGLPAADRRRQDHRAVREPGHRRRRCSAASGAAAASTSSCR